MTQFAEWCSLADIPAANHKLQVLNADPLKRGQAIAMVAVAVPDHYVTPGRLADLLTRLGRTAVAAYVKEKLPTSPSIMSGDLGEILCTCFVHEGTPFTLGIKRLRWKDHRNMAMRGDDVLAFSLGHGVNGLRVLKAEVKSRAKMLTSVITAAREALSANGELPSAHAMSFVADRLNEAGDKPLRDALDDAQLKRSLKASQVTHMLFCFSGNDASTMLTTNLSAYTGEAAQHYVGLWVEDQLDFIKAVFAAAEG